MITTLTDYQQIKIPTTLRNPIPWQSYPTPGELLPLASPSHHCHSPSMRPCQLVGGCANPHLWQCKPMLGELLPLGLPSHHLCCPVLMWHHRAIGDHRSTCPWPKSVKDWGQCPQWWTSVNVAYCAHHHRFEWFNASLTLFMFYMSPFIPPRLPSSALGPSAIHTPHPSSMPNAHVVCSWWIVIMMMGACVHCLKRRGWPEWSL